MSHRLHLSKAARQSGANLKVVSLFSGCGGLDAGFVQAGFEVLAAYESDARMVATYNNNLSSAARQRTLNETSETETDPDVVVATPPCQGFSTAGGYRKADPRNDLLEVASKLIVSSAPRVAVIENVAALGNARNREALLKAVTILGDGGYYVDYRVLEAERFGVPQRRRRMFIIARKGNAPFHFGTFGQGAPCRKLTSVFAALDGHFDHNPKPIKTGSAHESIAKKIGPGQKLCNVRVGGAAVATWKIPEVFGIVTEKERFLLEAVQKLRRTERTRNYGDADPVSVARLEKEMGGDRAREVENLVRKKYLRRIGDAIDLTNTFNGKYRRLNLDDVSPTVDTRFGDFRLFLHPIENRGMTVREAARIQCFSDDFVFDRDERVAFTQVGNAVPPPLGRAVAEFVRELL